MKNTITDYGYLNKFKCLEMNLMFVLIRGVLSLEVVFDVSVSHGIFVHVYVNAKVYAHMSPYHNALSNGSRVTWNRNNHT